MKKIKRTITMRKVEITVSKTHEHDTEIETCPLCHSPFIPKNSFPKAGLPQLEEKSDKENDSTK